VIGVTLPLVLIVFDALIFEQFSIRRSLSAYYHSGVRDWFVGSLCAIGVGLFAYMGTRLGSFDNWVSTTSGVCAIVVAFFPVKTAAAQMPTELQTKLGEALVQSIHFMFAAIFFTLLGLMSLRFGIGDGRRPDRTALQRKGWRVVHFRMRGCNLALGHRPHRDQSGQGFDLPWDLDRRSCRDLGLRPVLVPQGLGAVQHRTRSRPGFQSAASPA
jgi:hypothetical protein